MKTLFAQDLRLARRKASLTLRDVTTLLDAGDKELPALEAGKRLPSLLNVMKLSLIYGRSFSSLYSMVNQLAKRELFQQLPSLPEPKAGIISKFNRENTLKRLEKRLVEDVARRNERS